MKKKSFLIATLLVIMAAAVVVVSCKKEDQNALLNNNHHSSRTFTPPKVDDMNAYLSDFKQRMKESPYAKEAEFLSLEEAAWHLSSVANYDFAYVGRPFDDLRFDTLYSTVTITNGSILMSDLAATYQDVGTEIDKFFHGLALNEKHIHFINAFISNDGTVAIPIMTTFIRGSRYLGDTLWAYPDMWDLMYECINFFDEYTELPSSTTGWVALGRFLNWKENRLVHPEFSYYYTITSYDSIYYRNEIDPFGSANYMNSRMYASDEYFDNDILPNICYLCDSYLGLGHEHCPSGLYVINWFPYYDKENPIGHEHHVKEHISMLVNYGERHEHTPSPGGGGAK